MIKLYGHLVKVSNYNNTVKRQLIDSILGKAGIHREQIVDSVRERFMPAKKQEEGATSEPLPPAPLVESDMPIPKVIELVSPEPPVNNR